MLLQQPVAMPQLRSRLRVLMVYLNTILFVVIILLLLPILILALVILTILLLWLPQYRPTQRLPSKWARMKADREPTHPEV